MVASYLQKCGHKPIILVGGGTASIGDPSGKTEMRKMLSREQIDANVATMENQVDPSTKHDRSEKLLQLNEENFNKFGQKMLDKEFNVLFEQKVGDNKYEGLTENYVKVIVESDNDISEQILKVKIKDVKNEFLEGLLV